MKKTFTIHKRKKRFHPNDRIYILIQFSNRTSKETNFSNKLENKTKDALLKNKTSSKKKKKKKLLLSFKFSNVFAPKKSLLLQFSSSGVAINRSKAFLNRLKRWTYTLTYTWGSKSRDTFAEIKKTGFL